ncbi:Magnesium-like protein [Mycena venus]|uniref:Magnesium-like protein n=1 Tax=Mycena venus TaxID=2733690 RepID=A0A8H6YEX6_9AGAR|nr:Magnesium-like protein [Mycena venus]
MPRENSFSDSDGRSLTPDLEDEFNPLPPSSPTYAPSIPHNLPELHTTRTRDSARSRTTGFRATASASIPPIDRFRCAVRKVIALHRGTKILSQRGAGAGPGVDPRRATADAEYGGIRQECVIDVADYSAVRTSFRRMTNREFVELMDDAQASARESWVKVRWINIGGMSWDVIKAVSLRYDLNPLALEDVFHAHPKARSKADYYAQHLFLRIVCHELNEDQGGESGSPHSYPPTQFKRHASDDEKTLRSSLHRRHPRHKSDSNLGRSLEIAERDTPAAAKQQRLIQDAVLTALKSGERVNVNVVPMFIFLFRDGTVITIHSTPNLNMTEPIASRVRQFDTILRTSADASLLVINAYQDKIKKFERMVMAKPTVDTVRNLHILSADLILQRRTLAPIKTLIYGLRRYDIDRAAALMDVSALNHKDLKVAGFMSPKSIIYLADVHEHMEYVLSQLDVIAGIGQNLADYTFNMASYQMNEVMRRLMLVTVTFLPLTVLTGYFGMNFEGMTIVQGQEHGDWVYWSIAVPIMVIIVPLFVAPDIKRMIHYFQKQAVTKKAIKSFE